MNVLLKSLPIGIGALVLATLSLYAIDEVTLNREALLSSLSGTPDTCEAGAVPLTIDGSLVCVDQFEASPGERCPHESPLTAKATEENLAQPACLPISKEAVEPWSNVSLTQAQQFCARAKKRLPTTKEWYTYSVGVADVSTCTLGITTDGLESTGLGCATPDDIYDSIGNLWEWVGGEVVDGQLNGKTLPQSGYVTAVDMFGVPLSTNALASSTFGEDYFQADAVGVFGVVRGGFYGSGTDGGLFAMNAAVPHSLATPGIGFRCVQDVVRY